MKILIMVMIALTAMISSCKKSELPAAELGTLQVVNAVTAGNIVQNANGKAIVPNNLSLALGLHSGLNNLYLWPTGDSLHPYYTNSSFSIAKGEFYSLFLCGTPAAPEGILLKESFPYITDSSFRIRIINLSPNSTPLNVTLSTSTSTNEFSGIGYKQITDFKSYAGLAKSTYVFQVRAVNNPNTVLTSVSYTTGTVPRFRNLTLVIRGLVNSSPSIGVTQVVHDR